MWLINWLIERFSALWYVLVDKWGVLRDLLERGINWFYGLVYEWFGRAVATIQSWVAFYNQVVRDFTAEIRARYNWVVNLVTSLASSVYNRIAAEINTVRAWVNGLLKTIWEWVQARANEVIAWTQTQLAVLRSHAEALFVSARDLVFALIDSVISWIASRIQDVIAFIETVRATLLAWVIGLVSPVFSALKGFIESPAETIFAYLEAYLYRWLEWWLAFLLHDERGAPAPPGDLFKRKG